MKWKVVIDPAGINPATQPAWRTSQGMRAAQQVPWLIDKAAGLGRLDEAPEVLRRYMSDEFAEGRKLQQVMREATIGTVRIIPALVLSGGPYLDCEVTFTRKKEVLLRLRFVFHPAGGVDSVYGMK